MDPVARLLRRNISVAQTAGYAMACLIGLGIVLTAVQLYRDLRPVAGGADAFASADYMVVAPRVGGGAPAFGADRRADIAAQPWAAEVADFKAADFNVAACVDLGGQSFSTALFLEALPDRFLDIAPPHWEWTPGTTPFVPLVISKDYLTLYNFGFAASRGLPQMSEQLISMMPLRLSISGAGRQQWLPARIVGFSSRLNTIAVPEAFLDWANATFGENTATGDTDPSRLIVKLRRAGDPAAAEYMRSHGYEVAGDRADTGRAQYFLTLVTGVVVAIGAVISALACVILVLSIHLLLQKNRTKLHDLMLLGYTPGSVAAYYCRLVGTVNAAVWLAASALTAVAASVWGAQLLPLGVTPAAVWPTIALGTALMAAITLGNILLIRRRISAVFRL